MTARRRPNTAKNFTVCRCTCPKPCVSKALRKIILAGEKRNVFYFPPLSNSCTCVAIAFLQVPRNFGRERGAAPSRVFGGVLRSTPALTNAGREPGCGRPFHYKSVIVLKTKKERSGRDGGSLRNSGYDPKKRGVTKAAPLPLSRYPLTSLSISASDLTFRSVRIALKKSRCIFN